MQFSGTPAGFVIGSQILLQHAIVAVLSEAFTAVPGHVSIRLHLSNPPIDLQSCCGGSLQLNDLQHDKSEGNPAGIVILFSFKQYFFSLILQRELPPTSLHA